MTEYKDIAGNRKPDCVKDDGPVRECIVKLAKKITDRPFEHFGIRKITKDSPEYWGLAAMCTDEEAELALKLNVRDPKTFEEIQALSGIEPGHLQELLDSMSISGLLEYNWENLDGKNPEGKKRYVLPMFVPGIGEFSNMNEKLLEEKPELGRFFERMAFLPLEHVTKLVPPGGAGIGMHVIPVEKAISMEDKSIPIEHISHWLEKYEGKYAASPCSCRMSRKTYDEGCADDFHDWCIAVGDMADYVVETQKGGRYITKEEALEILRKAEDNGFVHQITNIDGENKIFAICNCNVNVCYALRTSQLFNTPNMSRSAYAANVDSDKCVACGRCVEYCPAGALKLGQKLCKADGTLPEYPKISLPSEEKWGVDKWSLDYRDTNRINCHETGTSPCKTACPAHIAVQGYLKLAAQGKYTEALQLIKRENPFPAVCGKICNRRCEDACTRGSVDSPVAIDDVKDFIARMDLDAETRFIPEKVIPKVRGEFEEKIAIIGGGPAGLSCAYYLAEKGYRPTVFEKEDRVGGMLMNGIPSFRLEKDVVEAEIDIIRELGVEFKTGVEVGKDVTIPELREQGYKGFYLAIGLQSGGALNVPGGDLDGVTAGIDMMREYNINPDSVNLSGKVAVIGGGNIACDVARTAVRAGAEEVTMYCLEQLEDMPCGEVDRTETLEDDVRIVAGYGPLAISGENGKVNSISFRKCVQVRGEDRRFDPKFDENDVISSEVSTVLYCIGQKVVWKDLLAGTAVEFNPNGTVKVDPVTGQTAEPDIFAGGDNVTGQKFVIDAIAAGKEGAISLHRFVQPHSTLTIGRNRREFIELDKNDLSLDESCYDNTPRQRIGHDKELRLTRRDDRIPFTEEQVKKETARCLGCGATIVDKNKCIGCGLCTTKCGFDAITIRRERPECSVMVPSEDKFKMILPYAAKQAVKLTFKGKKR